MSNSTKAYLFAILAVLLWSTAATAFKISLEGMKFPMLLFISTLTSVLVFAAILIVNGQISAVFRSSAKTYAFSALAGFLNPFLYYMVLLQAYSLLPAQVAQPLNYTWPVVLVLLSAPFLRQKVKARGIIALLICLAGVVVIASQGNVKNIRFDEPFGLALAAGSSIIWAFFWIINMKDERPEPVKLFLNFTAGLVFISLYLGFTDGFVRPELKYNFAAVYVGLFEMGITFFLWMLALRYSKSPEKISSLVYLSPFLSLIFISVILKESIHYTTLAGIVLIVLGILYSKLKRKSPTL